MKHEVRQALTARGSNRLFVISILAFATDKRNWCMSRQGVKIRAKGDLPPTVLMTSHSFPCRGTVTVVDDIAVLRMFIAKSHRPSSRPGTTNCLWMRLWHTIDLGDTVMSSTFIPRLRRLTDGMPCSKNLLLFRHFMPDFIMTGAADRHREISGAMGFIFCRRVQSFVSTEQPIAMLLVAPRNGTAWSLHWTRVFGTATSP